MSKVIIFTSTLQILLLILCLNVKEVNAAPAVKDCPGKVQVNPPDLNNKSENAQFTINLGDEFYDSSVTKWQVQFECGPDWPVIGQQAVDATPNADSKTITTTQPVLRSRSPIGGCEFFPGDHRIQIKGDDTYRCQGKYVVLDADTKCQLSIDPSDNITTSVDVKVSGKNLTDNAQFHLYVDGVQFTDVYVNTPTFSDKIIPKDRLTPTAHQVSLRRDYTDWLLGRVEQIFNPRILQHGPMLCPLIFTVGTPDHPGRVFTNASVFKGCTPADIQQGKCNSSGGQPVLGCTEIPDPNDPTKTIPNPNPGIATAIGCIHTNPAEFVKDLMKFIIGISGGLAFLMMLLGAFQILSSADNPDTLKAGRERLTNAVIGLLIVIFAVLLLQIIGAGILAIPEFK